MRTLIAMGLLALPVTTLFAAEADDMHANHAAEGSTAGHSMSGGGCRMCAAGSRMERTADQADTGMRGMGMSMDAMPMQQHMMWSGGMAGMPSLVTLDLTAEQRQRIEKIQNDTRNRHWQAFGSVLDAQSKLRELYAAETLDAKAIGAAYADLARAQRQVIEGQAEATNLVRSVLTPAQREQLKRPPARMACGMMGRHAASPSVPSIKQGG